MMKNQVVAAVLAVSVAGGIGTGFVAHSWNKDDNKPSATSESTATPSKPTPTKPTGIKTDSPASEPTVTPTKKPVSTPPVSTFQLAPGSVGPVKVGMTKQQALATGLFDADVKSAICDFTTALQWKKAYQGMFDVHTPRSGEITSIGVWSSGARTQSGLGVGSTYGEVRAAIDDAIAQKAGYDQAGVFNFDPNDGGWIGFLFDSSVDSLKDSDKVTFVEVTKGGQPGLMRDGC